MALPASLLRMMRHKVVVEPFSTAASVYGGATYGAATSYTCRVVSDRKVVRDLSGNEVVSTCQVWLGLEVVIDPRSRVTLPAGTFTGQTSQPRIISTAYFPDAKAGGMSHSVIYL